MAKMPLPKNAAIVSSLDPTYTLKGRTPRVSSPQLPAFLRLHYLFLGPLVIPRTYLIHGRHNPFIDLYRSGQDGLREIADLFTSGAAFVTGHDNSQFRTLRDHLAVTAGERHPMVFDYKARAPIAEEMDALYPPERGVTVPAKKVTKDFRDRFEAEILSFRRSFPRLELVDWKDLDAFGRIRLKQRNKWNVQKYPEDHWGRNEVYDFILQRAQPREVQVLADCAVATYQRVFAASSPHGSQVVMRSTSKVKEPPVSQLNRSAKLSLNLATDARNSKVWEFDCIEFGRRPWEEIKGRFEDIAWKRHLTNYRSAVAASDRKLVEGALTNLFEILRSAYPVRKSRIAAAANWVANNTAVVLFVDIVSAFAGPPLTWYVVGPHATVAGAAHLNALIQQYRRGRNVRHHVNYLLEPVDRK